MSKHFQSKLFRDKKHRITAMVLSGFILMVTILYWRYSLIKSLEYVPFTIRSRNPNATEMHSKNYQLQTQEISPAVK